MFTIAILDSTKAMISAKEEDDEAYDAIKAAKVEGEGDNGFNPGESFTVMTSDLFMVEDGYTAAYGVSVEGDSVSVSASGDSITVNAKSAGDAKITVTGTARMASSSFDVEQTVSNIAHITFPVMVEDAPVPEPEPENQISAKPQDEAYPAIMAAIAAGLATMRC